MNVNNNSNDLHGVVPIIPTPFDKNGEIDEEGIRRLVDFAISNGITAGCLPAYASEFYKLAEEEKLQVVRIAVSQSSGRMKVVAQSNHPALNIAIKLAQANVDAGADVISLAVPRMFDLPEDSIYEYLSEFMRSVSETPVLIQDFNPGGSSISVSLIRRLKDENPNFKYLKLEEPLAAQKFEEIINLTQGQVKLFEGWGGLYMMELIPLGIAGIMPGLGVSDILQRVFDLRVNNKNDQAFNLFEKVMPQIFFSLQNMELFHFIEKDLLVARGILQGSSVRKMAYKPDNATLSYIKELNERIVKLSRTL
ncbi:MAG: dihydrodipicolinate synthase family protein [Cyclobacteriaceae bacterium]|nr:MAG: dihydrodipicolinate synthase family protein [Cyclobacteriaceae bacterium]